MKLSTSSPSAASNWIARVFKYLNKQRDLNIHCLCLTCIGQERSTPVLLNGETKISVPKFMQILHNRLKVPYIYPFATETYL